MPSPREHSPSHCDSRLSASNRLARALALAGILDDHRAVLDKAYKLDPSSPQLPQAGGPLPTDERFIG